jgi:hypothetical protein
MRKKHFLFLALAAGLITFTPGLPPGPGGLLRAREKTPPIPADDPTAKLYQFLDTSYDGSLKDFYVLGETFEESEHPGQDFQHVLRVEYAKDRLFGKFNFTVRNIAKLTPAQLKAYSPKAAYGFGSDAEKYIKTSAGPFGRTGDVYFHAKDNGALATEPVTPDVQASYEKYLTETIMPALEKAKKTD